MSKAEDIDAGLSPVNSVLAICFVFNFELNKKDAMDRCKWRNVIKDVRWSGYVWVGECFFWYRPTHVVLDKRPLNGCVCVC